MALTKSVQSAVMHAVMKHAGGKKHKAKAKSAPKEVKGVPDDEDPEEEDAEFEDEKPESAYQKYKEPKKKGK